MRHRLVSSGLSLGLLALVLAGCGGGSAAGPTSTGGSGGGGSTAVVQGQLLSGQRAATGEPVVIVALRSVLGIGLAEALAGDPVVGATVTLTPSGGGAPLTATTDATGSFTFAQVPPGTYTLGVSVGGVAQTISPLAAPVVVGAGDVATLTGTVTETALFGVVTVVAQDVSGVIQNDAQLGHALNLAEAAHRPLQEVLDLRQSGLGWGQIAHQLGVSPGVLGLGRSNRTDAELETARAQHGGGHGKGKGPQA